MRTNLRVERYHVIMKLIKLLTRELNNCSLRGDFLVLHHVEICQFGRFSLETRISLHYEYASAVMMGLI